MGWFLNIKDKAKIAEAIWPEIEYVQRIAQVIICGLPLCNNKGIWATFKKVFRNIITPTANAFISEQVLDLNQVPRMCRFNLMGDQADIEISVRDGASGQLQVSDWVKKGRTVTYHDKTYSIRHVEAVLYGTQCFKCVRWNHHSAMCGG